MLICTTNNHNKFWDYEINQYTTGGGHWIITYHWGRIGTKGQTATKMFSDSLAANSEAYHKEATKLNKGYRPATDEELRLIELQAKILGTANKIEHCAIVTYDSILIVELTPEKAADPSKEVGIFIQFWYKKDKYSILFAGDDIYNVLFASNDRPACYDEKGHKQWIADGGRAKMNNSHELWEFLEKLQEAVGAAL
jgi:predicted DNA-binding WGR domain protein